MFLFWANIDEADVEGFAGTLLLPSYMSHLTLAPFRIIDQPHNFDGQQPFILTYTGRGRVEQLPVSPQKHALPLLQYAVPALHFDAIRISKKNAIWNWDAPVPQFRIYFEPVFHSLQLGSQGDRFSPFQTYVSVSRKEMFIGTQILAAYFHAWMDRLMGKTLFHLETQESSFSLDMSAGRVRFAMHNIGTEWSVEQDEVFYDLLEFSGLKSSLIEIERYAVPDLASPNMQIGDVGILFQLTEPSLSSDFEQQPRT